MRRSPVGVEAERLELCRCCLANLGAMRIADLSRKESGDAIEQAIADQKIERHHFTLLRNLYEKTASFLGYPKWSELLPDDKQLYYSRIINFTSHSTLSNEAVAQPTPAEQATVKLLLDNLKNSHGFWQQQGA
jgi:hypothetical protein